MRTSKEESHMSRRAIQDVFELRQFSQQPANCFAAFEVRSVLGGAGSPCLMLWDPCVCRSHLDHKQTAILRRQYHKILTASCEKVYLLLPESRSNGDNIPRYFFRPMPSIFCGITVSKSWLVWYSDHFIS